MATYPGLYVNAASSTLASAPSATAATLSLQSGDGAKFPATGPFPIYVGAPNHSEKMLATARTGDTLTVTRGLTPLAWASGTPVYLISDEATGDYFGIGQALANITTLTTADGLPVLTANAAVATAASGTITTASLGITRSNPAGNIAAVVLQAGTVDGQQVIVENDSSHTITFDIAGTSHVADGVTGVIAALTAVAYIWNATSMLWYRVV